MKLALYNRGLTSLDGIDLTGVTVLDCSNNQLTSLPPLPASLERLYCGDNQLTSLPPLRDLKDLTKLYCSHNQLTSLPSLPASLEKLYCYGNQLSSLPPLPSSLKELYCGNNQLTSLPPLPASLKELYCGNNQLKLTELPDLPWGLNYWDTVKLNQHNRKRAALALEKVNTLPNKEIWDEINEKYLKWQYRIGGEKWALARNSFN